VAPEAFVSTVARHAPRVARACDEITGNDALARALTIEVFADLATAWPLAPDRAQARLVRALRRRASELRAQVEPAAFDLRPGPQPDQPVEGGPDAVAMAERAWRRGAPPPATTDTAGRGGCGRGGGRRARDRDGAAPGARPQA
jgi:hypothetical protein